VIRCAVVAPHPPLLVPELVTGAAQETEPIRSACVAAVRRLAEITPHWVAVAADPSGPAVLSGVRGTFAGFGVDVPVSLDARATGTPDPDLPLPALIAGWLREQAGAEDVTVHLVPPDLSPADCRTYGTRLASDPAVTGLLVLADGSLRHGDDAPARPDARAAGFEDDIRAALAAPDPAALLNLDPALAAELLVTGRPAWQILAAAALAAPRPWRADLRYSGAPYGVGYHVASWEPADSDAAG
jgi:hypothetical protein